MTVLDKNRFLLKYNLKSLSAMTKRHFSHEGLISIKYPIYSQLSSNDVKLILSIKLVAMYWP